MSTSSSMPPLSWVRIFRVAGKHRTFKAAAQSLNLAPSTVSHEIRKLEDWVGTSLFVRGGRSVELTEAGQKLLAEVDVGLARVETAFSKISAESAQELKIGVLPFMGSEFLVPVFDRMQTARVKLVVNSNNKIEQLTAVEIDKRVDAIIDYFTVPPADYGSVCLAEIELCLIKAPHVKLAGLSSIRTSGGFDTFGALSQAGVVLPDEYSKRIEVDSYSSVLRAVEQGLGFGVGVLPLCSKWISEGRIEVMQDTKVSIQQKHWMLWPKASPNANLLQTLGAELQNQIASESARSNMM